jgi:dGTPase
LSGITQVISPSGNYETHNRLTHTLEVAQIAKSIADTLLKRYGPQHPAIEKGGGLDPVVVEAAALAHDIGHPPFGHVTEDILRDLLREKINWGFEGNAQSFRILTTLSVKDDTYSGLNLTRATLSAVSKYPWLEGRDDVTSNKWGAYHSERQDLEFSREHLSPYLRRPPQTPDHTYRTIEARIMDWADDVAYAVHDIDDFFKVGLIPLDRLRSDDQERDRFLQYHFHKKWKPSHGSQDDATSVCEALLVKNSPFREPFTGSATSTAILHRHSSTFVHRYIVKVELTAGTGDAEWDLAIKPEARIEVELLKSLLWYYVIDNRILLSLRFGYASLIEGLFERLLVAAIGKNDDRSHGQRKNTRIFPESWRASLDENDSDENVFRIIADFIASLTESQAIDLHHRLTGIAFGKSLDRIV